MVSGRGRDGEAACNVLGERVEVRERFPLSRCISLDCEFGFLSLSPPQFPLSSSLTYAAH